MDLTKYFLNEVGDKLQHAAWEYSCKLFQENVSEAHCWPTWWFISHLAALWSYF